MHIWKKILHVCPWHSTKAAYNSLTPIKVWSVQMYRSRFDSVPIDKSNFRLKINGIELKLRTRSTFCMTFRISENKPLFWISWTDIELRDNKGHPKVYVFTKIIFFSFLKMWKFGVFLKSRFLPDNMTFGTSTENYNTFRK